MNDNQIAKFNRLSPIILYVILFVSIIANVYVSIKFNEEPMEYLSLFVALSSILATYLLFHNNRLYHIIKIGYLVAYVFIALHYKIYSEVFIKVFLMIPAAIVVWLQHSSWCKIRLYLRKLRLKRSKSMSSVTYYTGMLITLVSILFLSEIIPYFFVKSDL